MRMLSSRPAAPAAGWGTAAAAAAPRLAGLAASKARQHWLLTLLLAAGLAMRVVSQLAYRPALFYIDSIKYLLGAYPGNDPPGYELLLKPLLGLGNPFAVALLQHLLGLGMAVALYLLLRRRGTPRWLAALATAPVLLDGYQLQMEQSIMPDVWFEALLVTGLVALLWQRRPERWMLITSGLALGSCAAFRQVGEILILPALVYAFLAAAGWRQRAGHAAVLCAAFAVPIIGASFSNYLAIRHFSLAPYAASTIYGRVAEVADCPHLTLPSYERPLCPTPAQKRLGPDGLDHDLTSPIKLYVPPPGLRNHNLMVDFARRVVLQQPLSVSVAVAGDTVKLFALQRFTSPGDTPISRWQFQDGYPQYQPYVTIQGGQVTFAKRTTAGAVQVLGTAQQFGGGPPAVSAPLASFLRGYQLGGGYTPGPLFAFAVLAGVAGSLSLLRRRLSLAARAAAEACALVFTSAAILLLASDAFEFSWRYQLPAVVTLPPVAALALAIPLARRVRAGASRAAAGYPVAGPAGAPHAEPNRAPAS